MEKAANELSFQESALQKSKTHMDEYKETEAVPLAHTRQEEDQGFKQEQEEHGASIEEGGLQARNPQDILSLSLSLIAGLEKTKEDSQRTKVVQAIDGYIKRRVKDQGLFKAK